MIFLILSSLVLATNNLSDLETILQLIKKLHKETTYGTLYDLFGVTEFASIDEIRSKFAKLIVKTDDLKGFKSKNVAKEIITEAYNTLKNKKAAYDNVLANPYLFIGKSENFVTRAYIIVLTVFFGLIGIDFLVFISKYLKHASAVETKDKKASKKKQTKVNPPKMFIYVLYTRFVSLFKK